MTPERPKSTSAPGHSPRNSADDALRELAHRWADAHRVETADRVVPTEADLAAAYVRRRPRPSRYSPTA